MTINDPLAQASIRSLAALPLIVQDRLLGVLCVQDPSPHMFDDQLPFLTTFANQIAIAIENAQLHQRTLRQVEELVALNRISRALTSSPNLEEILETIVQEIALALKAEASSISLLQADEGEDELVIQATMGVGAEMVKGQRFSAKLGIAGWVTREGKPLIVNDAQTDPRFFPGFDQMTGFVTRSLLAVPLKTREETIGVIEVVNKTGGTFTEQDMELLSSIAHSTAVAIQNIVLMEAAAEAQVLRELDRLRSELVSNVSHELRTPLGLIKVFSTTLLSEDVQLDREVELECLRNIEDEADRLERIVDNLLDLSRVQSEYLELSKQSTDLGQLARNVAEAMAVHLTGHDLVFDLPERPLTALVDARRMEQVLRNLLSNASKYAPAGGTITIHGSRNRYQVLVGVSDEGIGISPEHLESIFERFFRVDNEVTRQVSGAGLGLAVCQGIVKAHGGRIWAESTPGAGSTFYFSLPAGQSVEE
jgi:K+-sensing histidine kinase KdpD